MSVDLAAAVGHKEADLPVSWNQRDLLLYALGIGAKHDDFSYIYELDPDWAPFPTYPVVLNLKGATQEVNNFGEKIASGGRIPGFPPFDPNRLVHASQSIEVIKTIPAASGPGWKLTPRIAAITENRMGIIVEREILLLDAQGTLYARLFTATFHIGTVATGEKFYKAVAAPPQAKPVPKDRAPDYVITDQTTPEQAVLYRLSADYNPLHIDPSIGQGIGFPGVILHGLATFGFGARAVVAALAPGDASALRYYGVRFTAPVLPGEALETRIWEVGTGPEGTTEVAFVTKNTTTGKVGDILKVPVGVYGLLICSLDLLGQWVAYVRKGAAKSKL